MNAKVIVYAIGLLLSALGATPGILARWRTLRSIVKERRSPTDAEFDGVDAEIAANAIERDAIIAAKP